MKLHGLFAKKRLLFLSAALFAFNLSARAEDEDAPASVQIHGYGTLGYSQILYEKQPVMAGENGLWGDGKIYNLYATPFGDVSKRGTFLRNSIVGINLRYAMNDKVTFYGQMVGTGTVNAGGMLTESFPVKFDMAMLNYTPFDWLSIRVGRQVMPTWMLSEQIDVGVTFPWIRPPAETYNLAPLKGANGIGFDVFQSFGPLDIKTGVRYGNGTYDDKNSYVYPIDLGRILIAYGEFSFNNMVKLRASYGETYTKATTAGTGVLDVSSGAAVFSQGNANYLTNFSFYSFGTQMDLGNLLLMGEFASTNQNIQDIDVANPYNGTSIAPGPRVRYALAPDSGQYNYRSWYATAAYHIGDWMPHITYATVSKGMKNPGNNKGLSALSASAWKVVKDALDSRYYEHTLTLGMNYNFTPTIIGKVQYEQTVTRDRDGTGGGTMNFINGPYVMSNDFIRFAEAAVAFAF